MMETIRTVFWRQVVMLFAVATLATDAHATTFDTASGELTVPLLVVHGTARVNARLHFKTDGTYEVVGGADQGLPAQCESFTDVDQLAALIKGTGGGAAASQALGCVWLKKTRALSQSVSSTTYVWADKNCSRLYMTTFDDDTPDSISLHQRRTGCVYDVAGVPTNQAGNDVLELPYVIVDRSAAFAMVLIQLNGDGTFQLLDSTPVPEDKTPYICEAIPESVQQDLFAAGNFQAPGTVAAVSDALGCANVGRSFGQPGWFDHNCNALVAEANGAKRVVARVGCGLVR